MDCIAGLTILNGDGLSKQVNSRKVEFMMLDNNLDQETSMAVLDMEQNAANMALGQAVELEEK